MPSFKSLLWLAALAVTTEASPLTTRASCDTANDWANPGCANIAVIFARGTFDSGNIGPWVGCPLRDALKAKFGNVNLAFQGVSRNDYSADLAGYVDEGGSESCARGLGAAVNQYAARCPSTKFVVSGWSQGALCARKSLKYISAKNRIIALTTFGDPVSVWQDTVSFPNLPSNTRALSYCQTNTPDPLCTNPLENFPTNPIKFIERLKAVWEEFDQANLNFDQKAAVVSLIMELPQQATKKIGRLGQDIIGGHLRRWLLTPQHFMYGVGNSPMTRKAAEDIFKVYQSS